MRSLCVINLGMLLLLLVTDKTDGACSECDPCVEELGQGKPFKEPVQFDLTKNEEIELCVDIQEVQFGWLKLKRRVYNGELTGPTWNVDKGKHIQLTVKNKLSDLNNEQPDKEVNDMNRPNTTNVHTHGLHISSVPPQDSVLIKIPPGEQYVYKYCLHEEQPSGTYWYHAHVHGSTLLQVNSGMAGMLIINDDEMPEQLSEASCPDNCDADIQMVIQGILQFNDGFASFGQVQKDIGDDPLFRQDDIPTREGISLTEWLAKNVGLMTVNGLLEPVMTLKEDKLYRFRMVNAAGYDVVEPLITNKGTNDSADGCRVREIAYDGIYLDKPRELHQGQSVIIPGNRVDWLVICDEPGQYELRSYANGKDYASFGEIRRWNGLLVSLDVQRNADTTDNENGNSGQNHEYYGDGYFDNHYVDYDNYRYRYRRNQLVDEMVEQAAEHQEEQDIELKRFFQWPPRWQYDGGLDHEGGDSPSQTENEFDFTLPRRPDFVSDFTSEENIKERFVMEFDTLLQLGRESWSSADNYRYVMTKDEMQEWHIINTDPQRAHPFHPHINSFQVISYNKYTGPFSIKFDRFYLLYSQDNMKPCYYQRSGLDIRKKETVPPGTLDLLGHDERYIADAGNTAGYVKVGDWRDVLLIPPLVNITIRFKADRYAGPLIIHCHLLSHEDAGMMMIANIVDKSKHQGPTDYLLANITSGNAFPGTCGRCDRYPFNNAKRLCDLDPDKINELLHNNVRPNSTLGKKERRRLLAWLPRTQWTV